VKYPAHLHLLAEIDHQRAYEAIDSVPFRAGGAAIRGNLRTSRVLPLVDKCRRTACRAIDRESKDIEAVVGADHIMELLRFDASRQIDLGIEDALIPADRVSQGRAGRIDRRIVLAGLSHGETPVEL
jgi:hypothetical protein